jgi:transcriptional regulator with XRE-family HTH domain
MVKEAPFSEWLNEQIQKSGMSQARFARLAGLDKTTISKRTVYRAAGLWPFEPEYPEQDDLNYLVAQLPDLRRQEVLEHVRVMLEYEQKKSTDER